MFTANAQGLTSEGVKAAYYSEESVASLTLIFLVMNFCS